MRIVSNVKAISRLFLILLLLISAIIGAFLSYLGVVGYYESLEYRNPETPSITISNVTFSPQDTTYFNLTMLYPTYSTSREPAIITSIMVSTEDNVLHDVMNVRPLLPYEFPKSESQTFECFWNWGNYTGETVEVSVSVGNGSGATRRFKTPLVDLRITDVRFDSTVSVSSFNMTVHNLEWSITYVNVTRIAINAQNATTLDPYTLPYVLNPDDSVPLACSWDWTEYQGQNITIAVHTLQGYTAYYPEPPQRTALPSRVVTEITDVLFDVTNTTCFNVTIRNSEDSPQGSYITLSSITVAAEDETFPDVPVFPPPDLPYRLFPNTDVTFKCSWNWTDFREKNVSITVHTQQGFAKSTTQATTPRVILTITQALFNATDTTHFNVTIKNSEFSLAEFVNITRITVENGVLENLTVVSPPSLNYTLYVNKSVAFKCNWDWAAHWNKNVTITIYSLQGYSASYVNVTPEPVVISHALFNASATDHFNITVENHEFSPSYVLVTYITVTFQNGTIQEVTVVAPTDLPYVLRPSELVIFKCSWNWSGYSGEAVTISVCTLEGYTASYEVTIP